MLIIGIIAAPVMVHAAELEPASALRTTFAINNFGQVSSSVWRGALPSDQALDELAGSGVKTIIDLRNGGTGCKHEEQITAKLGLKYIHIPIGFRKLSSNEIMNFLEILRDPTNLPVYVHCRQGADRTGILIGAYRILVQNWTFEKTYNEMRTYHFKPWLFSMKKSLTRVTDDELAKQAIQVAFGNK